MDNLKIILAHLSGIIVQGLNFPEILKTKVSVGISYTPAMSLTGFIYYREILASCSCIQGDRLSTRKFTSALFITGKNWKETTINRQRQKPTAEQLHNGIYYSPVIE